MTHTSNGNEVTPDGIVHRCSCGWVSRPCFSNAIASIQGQDHREAAGSAGNAGVSGTEGKTFSSKDADGGSK